MSTSITQYFSRADYVLALPMLLLTLFALGILLIDLLLPKEWKRLNAITALIGLGLLGGSGRQAALRLSRC